MHVHVHVHILTLLISSWLCLISVTIVSWSSLSCCELCSSSCNFVCSSPLSSPRLFTCFLSSGSSSLASDNFHTRACQCVCVCLCMCIRVNAHTCIHVHACAQANSVVNTYMCTYLTSSQLHHTWNYPPLICVYCSFWDSTCITGHTCTCIHVCSTHVPRHYMYIYCTCSCCSCSSSFAISSYMYKQHTWYRVVGTHTADLVSVLLLINLLLLLSDWLLAFDGHLIQNGLPLLC